MVRQGISVIALIACASCLGCGLVRRLLNRSDLPDQRQPAERVEEIRRLDVQRSGQVRLRVFDLGQPSNKAERVSYSLRRPVVAVEDADIRGMLDGRTKYPFNQGTAYHMRVGRRIDSPYHGELELKRAVARWPLPDLPPGARIASATIALWVEAVSTDSPLFRDERARPLHLYVYPLAEPWVEGQGGVGRDSFSQAAEGEVWWNEAMAGVRPWSAPGALVPRSEFPAGVGVIGDDDREIRIGGQPLRNLVAWCDGENRPLEVLLKLEDGEEDSWGTEIALLTSDFGDDHDVSSKRPRLELEVGLPYAVRSFDSEFVLEPGMEVELPVQRHPGTEVLLAAEVLGGDPGQVPPVVLVRGGMDDRDAGEWSVLDLPRRTTWSWSQVKISAAPRILELGQEIRVTLSEPWLSPGPREEQLPEVVWISPSGQVLRQSAAIAPGLRFDASLVPDEPGLWRYGWSFLPYEKQPPGTHHGEGLFFVDVPRGEGEGRALEDFARSIVDSVEGKEASDAHSQYRLHAFVRWTAESRQAGRISAERASELIDSVRQWLPHEFDGRASR